MIIRLSDEVKYRQLENIIKVGTGRELSEKEARYIKWLCESDMETFNTFKRLFQDMNK
jgi:hypothetical protein